MTVIACAEDFHGRKYQLDEKGIRHYTRVYLVESDNLADGGLTVGSALCIPLLYQSYVTTDGTDLGAIVKNITEVQHVDNPYLWTITVEYDSGPLLRQGSPSSSNDNRAAPDSRPWQIGFSSNKSNKVLVKDLTQPTNLNVLNSAGQPFDPPVTVPRSNPVVKVTAYKSSFSYSQIPAFQDTINLNAWQGFDPLTVKVVDYAAQSHFDNNTFCYQIDLQLEINYAGWDPIQVLDAGTVEKYTKNGTTYYRAITDAYGQPIHTPVPLDGNGHKLAPGGTPVYLSFNGYRHTDFSTII